MPDVGDDGGSVGADAGVVGYTLRTAAVEVLAADRDGDDTALHLLRPEGGGGLEGGDFIVHDALPGRGPDAEEKSGLGVERGFDGFCWGCQFCFAYSSLRAGTTLYALRLSLEALLTYRSERWWSRTVCWCTASQK